MTARSHTRQRQRDERRETARRRRAAERRGDEPRPVRDVDELEADRAEHQTRKGCGRG